jgi:REP element-mobilizing transposase RayT
LPDGVYHVTARGAAGLPIYLDDDDRLAFVRLFTRAVDRFDWACYAWCLMTNHYHAILETTQKRLSRGMHLVNGIYAQRFNIKHARRGHVFESRFGARVVDTDEHLAAACLYVAANPVRAGLCSRPDDWPWTWTAVRL